MQVNSSHIDPSAGDEQATFLPPHWPVANPLGFVAPAILQSNQPPAVKQKMAQVAATLVDDPMAMRQFCDRIYQLLKDDVRSQQERSYRYRRRH